MAKPVFDSRERGDKVVVFRMSDLPDSDLAVLMSSEDFIVVECNGLDAAGRWITGSKGISVDIVG